MEGLTNLAGLTGMTAHPADKLRHDPWRLLVMTTLLNKTAGRAVRPIFEILIKRYSTPQALSQGRCIGVLPALSISISSLR